jgi:putative membrane protein
VALLGFGVVIVRLRYMPAPDMVTEGHGWEFGLLMTVVAVLLVILAQPTILCAQRY